MKTRSQDYWFTTSLTNYCSALMLVLLFFQARHGIDLSDESFALIVISDPSKYLGLSFFGYLLHPLFVAINGSISLLRQINFAVTLLLTAGLFFAFLTSKFTAHLSASFKASEKISISFALASSAYAGLTFMGNWFPTPTYNILTLHSVVTLSLGVLVSLSNKKIYSYLGFGVVGVSLFLIAASKITTAALCVLVIFLYLVIVKRSIRPFLLLCFIAFIFFLLLIHSNNWELLSFCSYIVDSYSHYKLLVQGSKIETMFRIDPIPSSYFTLIVFFGAGLILSCIKGNVNERGTQVFLSYVRRSRSIIISGTIMFSIVILLWTLMLHFGVCELPRLLHFVSSIKIDWLCFFPLFLGVLVVNLYSALRARILSPQLKFALICLFVPSIIAFGSGVNYWQQSSTGCLFWVLGTVSLLLKGDDIFSLMMFSSFVQLVVSCLLVKSLLNPFMQPAPLYKMTAPLSIESTHSEVLVTDEWYGYLATLKQLAKDSGFVPGTEIISLTGYAPGALYVLGGNILGSPWLFGHPHYNRLQYADAILHRIPHHSLMKSWLLIEVGSDFSLPVSLIESFGLSIFRDYQLVGQVDSPRMGYAGGHTQYLLKPVGK